MNELLVFVVISTIVLAIAWESARTWTTRVLLVTVVSGTCTAQLLDRSRLTYPLDSWRMYSSQRTPAVAYRFRIALDAPERALIDYPFRSITPWSPGPLTGYTMLAPMTWRLVMAQQRCRCDHGDIEIDSILTSLVSLFERRTGRSAESFTITAEPVGITKLPKTPRVIYKWINKRNVR